MTQGWAERGDQPPFAYEYDPGRYVLGLVEGPWTVLYDCFFEDPGCFDVPAALAPLVPLYEADPARFADAVALDPGLRERIVAARPPDAEVWFDEARGEVLARADGEARLATDRERLWLANAHASRFISPAHLDQRLVERSYGFVPGFQRNVEAVDAAFSAARRQAAEAAAPFADAKARRKAFSALFREQVVPFAAEHGFARASRGAHRLVAPLQDGLSVALSFEHKRFGEGAYAVTCAYFDEPVDAVEDGTDLAWVTPTFPYHSNLMIESRTPELLQLELRGWLRAMALYLFPFIAKNRTHAAMLDTLERHTAVFAARRRRGVPDSFLPPAYTFRFPRRAGAGARLLRARIERR